MNQEDYSEQELEKSLTRTLRESDLQSFSYDLMEVGIDSIIGDEGIIQDIPIVNSLVKLWKTGCSVKDALFVKKLFTFLNAIQEIPPEQRSQMIDSLKDESTQEDVGEKLLSQLERLDSSKKAQILGRTFLVFTKENITKEEFWRIAFILDRLPLNDFIAIKKWKETDLNDVDNIRKHMYVSVGIGWFVLNASSTGFKWEERLCEIISDYLLNENPA